MFTVRSLPLVQMHNKNNMINSKKTKLQVAYEIRNQFDIGLNATYAKLERDTEVERSDSQLIYLSATSMMLHIHIYIT